MKNFFKKINNKNANQKGFTILEMIVALTIFGIMSALVLSKYGSFNQDVILTNLAYDVALNIRNAQSYGLNVKSAVRDQNAFDVSDNPLYSGGAYGVHFDMANPTKFILFIDKPLFGTITGIYQNSSNSDLSVTNIQKRSFISNICVSKGTSCSSGVGNIVDHVQVLDITFRRPDPNAIIKIGGASNVTYNSAEITLQAIDGTTKKVLVNSTGQISVI